MPVLDARRRRVDDLHRDGYGRAGSRPQRGRGGATLGGVRDPSHHFGATLALALEAHVESADADAPPGPVVPAGSTLAWTFSVTNGSNVALVVELHDDRGLVLDCPRDELAPGDTMTCTATSAAAAGAVRHPATAVGTAPGGHTVTAADPTHHEGQEAAAEIPALGTLGAPLLVLLLLAAETRMLRRGRAGSWRGCNLSIE